MYDGNDKMLDMALALTAPITGDVVSAKGSGVYQIKDAGIRNYKVSGITLSGADAGNYFIQGGVNASITGTDGEITPRMLIVTPEANQTKIFGGTDSMLTYTYRGAVSGEISGFSGVLRRGLEEDVGSYQITQGSLVLQDNGVFLKGNYELLFTERVDFTISAKSIKDSDITVAPIDDFVYSGKDITASLTVKDRLAILVEGTDYELDYSNNINVGEAVVTITGKGNYSGTRQVTFAITPVALSITATDKSKEFEASDPTLVVSLSLIHI